MNDERGQAAILAVLLVAIAAVAIAGLRLADARIYRSAQERRAGEAAVEAATAVVADAYAAEIRARGATSAKTSDMAAIVEAGGVRERARVAASDLSARNGGGVVSDVAVSCARSAVEVEIVVAGTAYRASFGAAECSRR